MVAENKERNERLVKDRETGMTWHQLSKMYGITFTQARRLYILHNKKYGKGKRAHAAT